MSKSFTPNDVAKELKAAQAPDPNQATILSKPTDTTQAKAEQAAKDAETKAAQQEAVATAAKTVEQKRQIMRERVAKTSQERAVDTVRVQLEIYKETPPGAVSRVDALQKAMSTALRFPKNNVLNTILDFFKENKDEDFLGALQALQGTQILDKSANLKIRAFYEIMMALAKGTANKQTIALNVVRNVFESDDLVNWIAVKMAQIARK